MYYGSTKDAKAANQFSRRHETPAALNRARDLHELDQAAKVHDAMIRQSTRDGRSPEEQIAELDRRLGVGVGAVSERKRLTAQLSQEHQSDFALV